jgi:hypothetical protein
VDPGPISIIFLSPVYLLAPFTLLSYYYSFPLDTLIPLFTPNRWDWQPHRKLGIKYLVVLCAGSTLLLVEDALTHYIINGALVGVSLGYQASPSVVWLLPLLIDKPWFPTEGKPCYYIHHTFLLGFPTGWWFTSTVPQAAWTLVQFPLHCHTILLLFALFTFLHTIILLPLDTLNPLFTANRWDWQPYRKLGAKFLVVLCVGFMLLLVKTTRRQAVVSGALVRSVTKLASTTFWSLAFSYWFD